MDITAEIKKHNVSNIKHILEKLIKIEKCVMCNNITTHKEGKMQRNCKLNVYNGVIRAILCDNCNNIEENVRKLIETHMTRAELLKKYDKNKMQNLLDIVYQEEGIVPMDID
jgi:hypothetical protein